MPTRHPTATQALVRPDAVPGELRLSVQTNTGRTLEEFVVYAAGFDAGAREQVERRLAECGMRHAAFRGDPRVGWRATVQSDSIDPAAAAD
ncbi:hypothetical protein QT381_12600 [Galbitalea sp. SE-J8]|uniref:hypothetical protein n=1 Tax=Galbitalea sp. SE-J8 TaxID=3054952 RepID=UPI00259C8E81|nr:hypothetical protein [Galbitalea sp. SE-J8]MDM4763848.1 hypothetical protein [Galbitalea sp. SE-J8]